MVYAWFISELVKINPMIRVSVLMFLSVDSPNHRVFLDKNDDPLIPVYPLVYAPWTRAELAGHFSPTLNR